MFLNNIVKANPSSRIMLSVAAVCIAAVLMYEWVVVPHSSYLHAAQQYQSVVTGIVDKDKVIRAKTSAKKAELKKLNRTFAQLRTAVFSSAESKKFFGTIENICNRQNCVFYSINFLSDKTLSSSGTKAPEKLSGITPKVAQISFSGSYDGVIRFLAELLNRPQKVSVDSLAILAVGTGSEKLECEMVFTIYTVDDEEIFNNE